MTHRKWKFKDVQLNFSMQIALIELKIAKQILLNIQYIRWNNIRQERTALHIAKLISLILNVPQIIVSSDRFCSQRQKVDRDDETNAASLSAALF